MKSILIVYASRFGSTSEIAHEIADSIENDSEKIRTSIIDLHDKSQAIVNLEKYDGIIVGSGIKYGRWTKESTEFLKKYHTIIKEHNIPLGVFVSSGEAANPDTYEYAKKKYLDDVFRKLNLDNGEIALAEAFGGIFDLSSNSNYNFFEKKMIKRIARSNDTGFIVQDGKLNDFRNWQAIQNWGTDFKNLVKARN
ncbi:MAG: flavodoxin domain-containing protein [Candidatus Hodarchaeales archaeon]|jgi:menaquinone-dependent protoporphyrinogen oxidase